MVDIVENTFSAPIPGQGMTAELGSRPWQNPPQYATVEEALEWYIPRLVSDEMYEGIVDTMELGISLTTMADTLQSGGVMQGLHTIDVGMLAIPVIIEMLAYIAEDAGIEYTMGTDKRIDDDKISAAVFIFIIINDTCPPFTIHTPTIQRQRGMITMRKTQA